MSRETAVTENISYATDQCNVCGEEVVVDDVPEDVIELEGYVVLLGEGRVTRESEDAGNWDEEVHFELEKEASDLPAVSACIVCENCTESLHGISPEGTAYTGTVPSKLATAPRRNAGKTEVPDWITYLVGAVVLLVLLLALL